MAASSQDRFTRVGTPGSATTLAAPGHTIGGTAITVGSTSNWDTITGQIFAMDTVTIVNGKEVRDVGSYTEWEGVVSSSTSVTSLVLRYGTDQNYPAGSTTRVYIPVASSRENRLVDGILVSLDQDGTLKAGAVDNTAAIADGVVTTAKILNSNITTAKVADAAITPAKWTNPYMFSAWNSTATGIAASFVPTKILFQTEEYDLNNNFASSTYTAPVAGYYQFYGAVRTSSGSDGEFYAIYLYKNGTLLKEGSASAVRNANQINLVVAPPPILLAANDTIEIYAAQNSAGVKNTANIITATYFGGYLIRTT